MLLRLLPIVLLVFAVVPGKTETCADKDRRDKGRRDNILLQSAHAVERVTASNQQALEQGEGSRRRRRRRRRRRQQERRRRRQPSTSAAPSPTAGISLPVGRELRHWKQPPVQGPGDGRSIGEYRHVAGAVTPPSIPPQPCDMKGFHFDARSNTCKWVSTTTHGKDTAVSFDDGLKYAMDECDKNPSCKALVCDTRNLKCNDWTFGVECMAFGTNLIALRTRAEHAWQIPWCKGGCALETEEMQVARCKEKPNLMLCDTQAQLEERCKEDNYLFLGCPGQRKVSAPPK